MNFRQFYFIEDRTHGKLLSELKPVEYVTIFRARDMKDQNFYTDDYVTLSPKFALEHSESNHVYEDKQQIVIRQTVPAKYVAEASNPGEWFYIGPKTRGVVVYKSLGPDKYEGDIIDLRSAKSLKL